MDSEAWVYSELWVHVQCLYRIACWFMYSELWTDLPWPVGLCSTCTVYGSVNIQLHIVICEFVYIKLCLRLSPYFFPLILCLFWSQMPHQPEWRDGAGPSLLLPLCPSYCSLPSLWHWSPVKLPAFLTNDVKTTWTMKITFCWLFTILFTHFGM